MVTREDILKQKEQKLNISRIPKQTKDEFLQLADYEFCGDYGMTLKYVWDMFKMWRIFFENMDYKLDEINQKIGNTQNEKSSDTEGKKMMGGNVLSSTKSKRNE